MGSLEASITPATIVGVMIACVSQMDDAWRDKHCIDLVYLLQFLVPSATTIIYNLYFHPLSKFPGTE